VLTGGGAMLPGMLDVTESQLRVPARTLEIAGRWRRERGSACLMPAALNVPARFLLAAAC